MPRKIRFMPQGLLVEVTCRTLHGRFLFKPTRGFREIFVGVLARAQERYPVTIHFAVCLSGHFHLLVTPEDAHQLAAFMRFVNTNLSKEAGRLHDWRGKIIERRYQAILVSNEPAAQMTRLRYLLAHGVKEGLVAAVFDWPGAHGAHCLATGHAMDGIWMDRAREYAASKQRRQLQPRDLETRYRLALAPLPCWAGQPEKVWRGYVKAMIRDIEQEASERRRREGGAVLGRDAILCQHPHERPQRIKWSPAPFVHAVTKAARWEIYRAFALFVEAYYRAKQRLIEGDLTACFPDDSFPPPLPLLRLPAPS